eukprot:CAMPEP_0170072120 /NCGR_PEP_ID=MMETSP0019_2-20121128/9840_1 /TAXON_ID=98059 /ORGANISM="Dinobryon sp., Strain UTEXLB2267" /LENGTH=557 /DNA_ID=CAMNT_0010280937 /DNA_START=182 /DNA_END=1855 /DNA_ORIENTATION=+
MTRLRSNLQFISNQFATDREVDVESIRKHVVKEEPIIATQPLSTAQTIIDSKPIISSSTPLESSLPSDPSNDQVERRGILMCNGKQVDSEVIYWKIVPGDSTYESPITPHHGEHHDRYITFEYDGGGWNNVRMSLESLIVVAHAMGRTLVVPPQQHLYLLGKPHKDKDDKEEHDEMGFADFFDVALLESHRGFHVLHMDDFLQREGVTGGLHGRLPPGNSSDAWGQQLWKYLQEVADETPAWLGRHIVFPSHPGDFEMKRALQNASVLARLARFEGDRGAGSRALYDSRLQQAHHIHIPGDDAFRILQHHYAFAFFADPDMQSFYRRFVRDYMRYKDDIQCAGAELLARVRQDSLALDPSQQGLFYALHIRRGDFQYKDVKISTPQILRNLRYPNGTAIIPVNRSSLVYISTDDPDGVCAHCYADSQACSLLRPRDRHPEGCPDDPSWKAFLDAGWHIRFLRDYLKDAPSDSLLRLANPNTHGMLESIVCSRAAIFAGTYFSTFTGYIHRLRGYHGLGEMTYYHSTGHVFALQNQNTGHGWSREYRAGWTDDGGEII